MKKPTKKQFVLTIQVIIPATDVGHTEIEDALEKIRCLGEAEIVDAEVVDG